MVLKLLLMFLIIAPLEALSQDASYSSVRYTKLSSDSNLDEAVHKLQQGEFTEITEVPFEPQYLREKLWINLRVKKYQEEDLVLSYPLPPVSLFEVYKKDVEGNFTQVTSKDIKQSPASKISSGEYLIAIKSFNLIAILFNIQTQRSYEAEGHLRNTFLSAAVGIFFILVFYSLVVSFTLRNMQFLFFAIFIFLNGASALIPANYDLITGFYNDNFFKYAVFYRPIYPLSFALFTWSILFSRKERSGLLYNAFVAMNMIYIVLIGLALFPQLTHGMRSMWDLLFAIHALFILTISIYIWAKRKRNIGYAIIAQLFFLITVILLLISLSGIIEFTNFTPLYLTFGLMGEIILMSFFLATNINQHIRSNISNKSIIQLNGEKINNLRYVLRLLHHDINNLLHVIINAAQIISNKEPDNKMIRKIVTSGELLQDLTGSIQSYEKSLDYIQQDHLSNVALSQLFNKLELLFEDRTRVKGITLEIEKSKDVSVLANESMLLNDVLANFISNSIKFTPENGTIKISWTEYHDSVTIKIKDTGMGIPKDKLSIIIGSDQKFTSDGTAGEKGNGYGVRIAIKTLKTFMGKYRVKSSTDGSHKGTTIYIDLHKSKSDQTKNLVDDI